MELYARVRRAVVVDKMSEREAARQFGLARETVRKMLRYSVPPGYRRQQPVRRPMTRYCFYRSKSVTSRERIVDELRVHADIEVGAISSCSKIGTLRAIPLMMIGSAYSLSSRNSSEHPVRLPRTDTRHLVARTALHAVETLALYTGDLGGANHLQGTKPENSGFALADSPAGQAAWIYDKFQSKTDNHGLAEDALSRDDMLDAISLYWFTNSAASSGRIYWENKSGTFAGPKLTLPVAVTVFPKDIPRLPRSWIEDTYSNLIHYGEADKGGHFAALEQPEILVSEIRTGLRTLRS